MGGYLLYFIAKGFALFFRAMPLGLSIAIARMLGICSMFINTKRYRISYANLKAALGHRYGPRQIKKILKNTYANIGQGMMEVFLLPGIDDSYIERYITFENFGIAQDVLARGKGLIFLTAHFGTWEISHAALPYKGLCYKGIARQQKPYILDNLLNSYRQSHGCRILIKGPAIKEALRTLRSNGIVGMLVDQDAGKKGIFTDLFKRPASWHRGVVEIALRSGAGIVPGFAIRQKGPYVKFKLFPALCLKSHLPDEEAIADAMVQYAAVLEDMISAYPDQWLWQHRRWKSTTVRKVIVLNDKKTGHLKQSQKVAEIIRCIWQERGYDPDGIRVDIIDVEFKNGTRKHMLSALANFSSIFCQGCMRCARAALKEASYERLIKSYADIYISCGSSTASVNLLFGRENNAKSIAVMKPASAAVRYFDLVIAPRHDGLRPGKNVVVTDAALSIIRKDKLSLCQSRKLFTPDTGSKGSIGVLMGGDTKNFVMDINKVSEIIESAVRICSERNMDLFVSTSRRTPAHISDYLKKRLSAPAVCKLLVIANEYNPPLAVESILALSDILLVSEESVSMVSEAASSRGYSIVFRQGDYRSKRHNRFLSGLEKAGYIQTAGYKDVYDAVIKALELGLRQNIVDDDSRVKKALEGLI
ncbi:MAG: ELM1/GtrOC1 family putative glycosyltransferase [Candidatus Omnitrophica bacterium]|nr:ELM1/GtrOC1 family putative glycosyltransferase [Candidatus Omnitrophota bacterium]